MKRIISTLIMLVMIMSIFSGCEAKSEAAQNLKNNGVLSQINQMKEQNKKPKEMFDYLNQNIKELNKADATAALGALVSTLEEYEEIYSEQLFEGNNPDLMLKYFESAFDYSKIEAIKEQDLKDLLYDISLGGFKIMNIEGSFSVMVDYEALKTFDEYVDDEIKAYIKIMALRYNNPSAVDASIVITPEEMENRIMQMESYIKSFNQEQRKEMITEMYLGEMMLYMSGSDNSPVFDFDTGVMDPEMFKVFENAVAKYKDAVFGKVLSKYVEVLKAEGFTNTDNVQNFILNIDQVVKEQIGK